MTKVIIDPVLRGKLHDLSEPMEFCDETGRVVGRYVPVLDPAEFEGLEPQISAEEIQRRKLTKGKAYSTAEVLAHLEKL